MREYINTLELYFYIKVYTNDIKMTSLNNILYLQYLFNQYIVMTDSPKKEATMKLAESNNSKVIIIGSGKDGLPLILGNN